MSHGLNCNLISMACFSSLASLLFKLRGGGRGRWCILTLQTPWFLHVLSSLSLAFCNKGPFIKDVRSWKRGDDSPKADIIKEEWI